MAPVNRPFVPVLATLLVTAGCLSSSNDVAPSAHDDGLAPLEVPVPVHVVLVGIEAGLVDAERLFADLPVERQPIIISVSGTTGTPTYQQVLYQMTYDLHEAPAAFADALFAFALGTAQPGRPNAWLVDYDAHGERRLCSLCLPPPLAGTVPAEDPKDILYLDAFATEKWIAENAPAHGLDFGPTALTLFLLDGEGQGTFPTDTYHYWRFDDGFGHSKVPTSGLAPTVGPAGPTDHGHEVEPFHTPKDPIAMRAWGGRWNFAFLDLTAAPSAYDFMPHRPYDDWVDPPLWDVRDDPGTLNANLRTDLADLLQLRVARDPLYPIRPYDRFVTPIHVFVEEGAMENPETGLGVDLETWVPQADIVRAIERLMPWVEVESEVMFHMLPQDDQGMADALAQAKRYSNPSLVSAGIVKAYVRDHWDEYVPEAAPGEFVMPQFYFFFNGPYTFWGVSTAGGWADGDAQGRPWAIFNHFFDLCVRTNTVPCSKATIGFPNLTILPVHEAGHELGLMHTKDGSNMGDEGWPDSMISWLWDSMFSTMSYRHTYMQYDSWDKRHAAISHAEAMLVLAHDIAAAAEDDDTVRVAALEADARDALREGRWLDAVAAAREALDVARTLQGLNPTLSVYPDPDEVLETIQLQVPASMSVIGTFNLGVAGTPNPLAVDFPGASYASYAFDVPEDAKYVRIHYRDAVPGGAGTFKQTFAVLLGPDGSYRGGLGESYEDDVMLTSHWRGAGTHELRLYQYAGTPGLYDVEIGIGK